MNIEPALMNVVSALTERRVELGLNQRELDDRLGVGEGQVAKWEAGHRRPTGFLLGVWCTGLGMELVARPTGERPGNLNGMLGIHFQPPKPRQSEARPVPAFSRPAVQRDGELPPL